MTDNKFIDAFKRMLTMTLALIMVLGSVVPIATQEASAFDGKKGSKYTVYDGGQIVYGSGSGGYSNSRKCDLGDDLGSRYSYCVQPSKSMTTMSPISEASTTQAISARTGVSHIWLFHMSMLADHPTWPPGVERMPLTSVKYGPRRRSSAMSCTKQILREMLQYLQVSRCSSAICPEYRT